MQSSSRSRSFKPGLIGASPITDATLSRCNQFCTPVCEAGSSSCKSTWERHFAEVDRQRLLLVWSDPSNINSQPQPIPPLCLRSYRASFVNSYSSVQVRPEAPFYGDHDVTAASRPVTAFVLVRIRLVTPISMGRSCCGIDTDTNCRSTFQFGVLVLPRSTCPCRYGGFVQT